jgi:hypothetical protein
VCDIAGAEVIAARSPELDCGSLDLGENTAHAEGTAAVPLLQIRPGWERWASYYRNYQGNKTQANIRITTVHAYSSGSNSPQDAC